MSLTGKQTFPEQAKHTHTHFSLWGFLTQMARHDNSIKQKSHLTVQTSRLLLRLMEPAIHHLSHVNPECGLIHQTHTTLR